jgi:Domain of unknown function (DUF4259)
VLIIWRVEQHMGAWGAGPFQNDDALAFLAELTELPPAGMGSRITSALALPSDGYLELPEACAAIAAAGLIAAARSAAIEGPDAEANVVVQSNEAARDAQLRDLALAALVRVNGESSEWRDRWVASGSWEEADEMITGLRAELT